MAPADSPKRSYILSGTYRALRVEKHELGPLELAIVGFVGSKQAPRSYAEVHELIFEYYKINEPEKISGFIDRTIGTLERLQTNFTPEVYTNNPQLTGRVQKLLGHYAELKVKDVDNVTYTDFCPDDLGKVRGNSLYPFREHSNRVIRKLTDANILESSKESRGRGGMDHFLKLNPALVIERPT